MADVIRVLPDSVANQIAAGEVVLEPASVVKEMMENAMDAGAGSVTVNSRDGGYELVQIVDDGCGMSPIDARLAFDRHATSKIRTADDIYDLHTFGFRGEALASIGAVAQVELRTRRAEDEMGTQVCINGSKFESQTAVQCPAGSNFKVTNIFFNMPARRRNLSPAKKSAAAGRISAEFRKVALCNPDKSFVLYNNDAVVYNLPASSLKQRIVGIAGRHMATSLLELKTSTTVVEIEGFVCRPAAAKQRGNEQYLFVNGRYFKNAMLHKSILAAYEKLIPQTTQPSYFIYITVEPSKVDVNIHPQKTEVMFEDGVIIGQILQAAVRESLAKTGAVPMMDFDTADKVDIPVYHEGEVYREPDVVTRRDYNPFDYNVIGGGESSRSGGAREASDSFRSYLSQPSGGRSISGGGMPVNEDFEFISGSDMGEELPVDFIDEEPESVQSRMEGLDGEIRFEDVMCLEGGYAAARMGGRLIVADLRRVRECILFDRYMSLLGGGGCPSQQLLFPESLVLSADDFAVLRDNAADFAAFGFELDMQDECRVDVRGIPADMSPESMDETIYEMIDAIRDETFSAADMRRRRLAEVMSRDGARRSLRGVSREEAEGMMASLAACSNMSFTPGGKSVLFELQAEEIRKRLG